jgi:hypothetical protein
MLITQFIKFTQVTHFMMLGHIYPKNNLVIRSLADHHLLEEPSMISYI